MLIQSGVMEGQSSDGFSALRNTTGLCLTLSKLQNGNLSHQKLWHIYIFFCPTNKNKVRKKTAKCLFIIQDGRLLASTNKSWFWRPYIDHFQTRHCALSASETGKVDIKCKTYAALTQLRVWEQGYLNVQHFQLWICVGYLQLPM